MRQTLKLFGSLLGLLALAVLVVVLTTTFQSLEKSQPGSALFQSPIETPTPPPYPLPRTPTPPYSTATALPTSQVATPQPPHITPIGGEGTPTPKPSEFGTPLGIPAPTATPLRASRTTDLAPELPDNEKVFVYIQHSDRTIELFLIRRGADISTTIPFQAGDVVIFASLKTAPPRITASITPPSTMASPLATSVQMLVTPEH